MRGRNWRSQLPGGGTPPSKARRPRSNNRFERDEFPERTPTRPALAIREADEGAQLAQPVAGGRAAPEQGAASQKKQSFRTRRIPRTNADPSSTSHPRSG